MHEQNERSNENSGRSELAVKAEKCMTAQERMGENVQENANRYIPKECKSRGNKR